MKKLWFVSALFCLLFCGANAQETLAGFKSKDFKTAEFLLGTGTRFMGSVTANLNLQKNIGKHFSVLALSYMDLKPYGLNPDKTYSAIHYFNLLQSVGVGSSFGRRGFNASLYLLGGLRYHHTVEEVNGFHESRLATNAFLPDAALLLNLKIGKRKHYFVSQAYVQLTQLDPALRLINLTVGVGRRW